MWQFLGVTFLATEYSTGQKTTGRIDTLGIDENNCPVIIEYKRETNQNVAFTIQKGFQASKEDCKQIQHLYDE